MSMSIDKTVNSASRIRPKGATFTRAQKDAIAAFCFLIIPLIFFTIFVILPVIQAAYLSFYKWNGLGELTNEKLVGFQNFFAIFKDKIFQTAITNNVLVIIFSIVFQLPIALLIALVIGRKFKGSVVFRTIFFLPYILSEVISGVIWSFIYHPQFGLASSPLTNVFPWMSNYGFLGDPQTVFFCIFLVIIWKYFGMHMIIYIAGLQSIPDEVEEAAYIDGVKTWQLNWFIILPLLRPALLISFFFSVIGSFQVFDVVWAMSKGDPVNASETMVTYLYKFGFQRFQLGYGSAVAIVIFVICVVFNLLYQRTIAKQDHI